MKARHICQSRDDWEQFGEQFLPSVPLLPAVLKDSHAASFKTHKLGGISVYSIVSPVILRDNKAGNKNPLHCFQLLRRPGAPQNSFVSISLVGSNPIIR